MSREDIVVDDDKHGWLVKLAINFAASGRHDSVTGEMVDALIAELGDGYANK